MLGAILIGIGLGLSLAVAAGPIFLLIVDTSIEKGKKDAAAFVSGVWLSDSLFALLTYLGVNWITQLAFSPYYKDKISFAGALILFIFGVGILMDKGDSENKYTATRKRDLLKLFMKGFVLNTFNPFTLVFWLGISGGIIVNQVSSNLDAVVLYACLMGTVIFTDILKIILADRVSVLLKAHVINRVRRVVGFILIGCSFYLLYESFF